MTNPATPTAVYACCQHCEHEDGHRHLDPCEDEACIGTRQLYAVVAGRGAADGGDQT